MTTFKENIYFVLLLI